MIDKLATLLGRELNRLHECGFHYAEWDGSNVLFDESTFALAWSHLHRLRQQRRPLAMRQRRERLQEILNEFANRPRFQQHVARSYTRHWSPSDRQRFLSEFLEQTTEQETSVDCPPTSLRAA